MGSATSLSLVLTTFLVQETASTRCRFGQSTCSGKKHDISKLRSRCESPWKPESKQPWRAVHHRRHFRCLGRARARLQNLHRKLRLLQPSNWAWLVVKFRMEAFLPKTYANHRALGKEVPLLQSMHPASMFCQIWSVKLHVFSVAQPHVELGTLPSSPFLFLRVL